MRGSFLDFTRGSQVAETVGMMFGTALRPMFWTIVAILLTAVGYQLWQHTLHGDNYYWMMHSYAGVWHYFQFNPNHMIGLKMSAGDTVRAPIGMIASYPPLVAAWDRLTHALAHGTEVGLSFGIPLSIMSAIALRRFGHNLTERKHTRGATIASMPSLMTAVDAMNYGQYTNDRRQLAAKLYGRNAPLKMLTSAARAEVEAALHVPYTIAGIPFPWRAEQSHTMVVGTTGTGKSTAMKDLLRQIKARGDRAVVFDLTGTYVEGFYNPKTDILLNPFDSRCPAWSPFADAHTREHFKEVSQALIPISDNGGDSFWQETARMLFVETCVRLVQQGRGNNKALAEVLMTSKLKDLHAHVARTIAAPLTDPEAKRMAESIRATFNTYAQALMTLPDDGAMFSIRDWVLGIDLEGRNGDDDGFDIIPQLDANKVPDRVLDDAITVHAPPQPSFVFDPITGEIFDDDGTVEVAGEGLRSDDADASTGGCREGANTEPVAIKDDDERTAAQTDMPSADAAADPPTNANPLPETPPGSVLFVAAQHVNLRSVRVLLTMWITTAINTLMSMRGDQRDIRLWFLIDEIGALHNIPAIVAGMQTSRNYGGAFVLGVHTMAQLRETYGDNNAETISSLAKTKLLMNTRDRGTQDWESEQIGEGEWSELEENWSYGVDNVRDAATLQRKIKLEPLVLPTEFGELPDLHGYLKFPQGLPASRVELTYVKYRRQAPGFVERIIPPLELPGFDTEASASASLPTGAREKSSPPQTGGTVVVRVGPVTGFGHDKPQTPAPTAISAVVERHVGPALVKPGEGEGEDATAADIKPNDGGEGFQTVIATTPPERIETDYSRLFAQPHEVASGLPGALVINDRVALSQASMLPTGPTEASDKSSSFATADNKRGVDNRNLEAGAVGLGLQELRLNLTSTEKERHHGHVSSLDPASAAAISHQFVRLHLSQNSGDIVTARIIAEVHHATDRGDDAEYSR